MSPDASVTIRYRSRRTERSLLAWVIALSWGGFGMVSLIRWVLEGQARIEDWLHPLGFAAALLAVHGILMLARFKGDELVLPLAAAVAGFGMVLRYRLEIPPRETGPVEAAAALALVLTVLLLRQGRTRWLTTLWLPAVGLASVLLAWLLLAGEEFRGSRFAPGLHTPSEALKILLPIFLAGFLSGRAGAFRRGPFAMPLPRPAAAALLLALWAVPQTMLILQPDLGQVAIFGVVLVTVLFAATHRWAYVVLGGLATGTAGLVVYHFVSHGRARILAWLSPFGDPAHQGWQSVQSLLALFSGGLTGHGLALGSPRKVPVVDTDFIYAAVGEELGWIGSALLLGVYLLLFLRIFGIAFSREGEADRLLGIGLGTVLAAQTFLNVGGVVKFVPITGVTLPLISRGGSSYLVTAVMLGLILALSEPPVSTPESAP